MSKILDEDNSSQSISEQGDYFDECFSKNGLLYGFTAICLFVKH